MHEYKKDKQYLFYIHDTIINWGIKFKQDRQSIKMRKLPLKKIDLPAVQLGHFVFEKFAENPNQNELQE